MKQKPQWISKTSHDIVSDALLRPFVISLLQINRGCRICHFFPKKWQMTPKQRYQDKIYGFDEVNCIES